MKLINKKTIASMALPLAVAAAILPVSASMADTTEDGDKEASSTLEIPGVEDVDLGDMEQSYKVTADWGEGKVITDISTGDDGTGDGDGSDPIEPGKDGAEDGSKDAEAEASKDASAGKDGNSDSGKDGAAGADAKAEANKDGNGEPEAKDCDVDTKAATAEKVVLVDGTGGANATVKTCEKSGDKYTEVKSYAGKVGSAGIAAPGAKVEGDMKTPSGTYGLSDGFGVKDKPSQFSGKYTKVNSDYVWIDGDASAEDGYNTMGLKSKGAVGESLNQTPSYNHAQVVDYNMNPVKAGAGSAIFLHVNTNSGVTAGCISLPESDLLEVFKWESNTETQMQIVQ